jgi:hypothetical protein
MTPNELIVIYPNIDFLMAETILKSYENGNLESFFDQEPDSTTNMCLKSITVLNPAEPTKQQTNKKYNSYVLTTTTTFQNMRGDVSKLIFIDSTVSTDSRDNTKIMVPAHPFSTQSGEKQSLTLVSFTVRRNWYNINASNNTFYLYLDNFHYVVTIKPGVYTTFAALSAGIGDALTVTIANIPAIQNASTTYLSSNRLFTSEIT